MIAENGHPSPSFKERCNVSQVDRRPLLKCEVAREDQEIRTLGPDRPKGCRQGGTGPGTPVVPSNVDVGDHGHEEPIQSSGPLRHSERIPDWLETGAR